MKVKPTSREQRKMKRQFVIPAVAVVMVAFVLPGACARVEPAAFELDFLVVPPQVVSGELITIAAEVWNTGEDEGICTAILRIDGEEMDIKDVVVAPGTAETLTFTITTDEAGAHSVEINGLTGGFNVSSISDLPPEDTEEAKRIGLYLSGDLVAPDDLCEQVSRDLAAIRSEFGDEVQAVNRISFRLPWRPSAIIIDFDDATAQEIASGEYHAWDELNEAFEVVEIQEFDLISSVVLDFGGMLHSGRLAEHYVDLPGVTLAMPSWRTDGPNIYPRQTDNGIAYLFRDAWGDCPAGCIYRQYWFFAFEGDQPVFIGHWAPYANPEEPDWWDDVW